MFMKHLFTTFFSMKIKILVALCFLIAVASSAPLYGKDSVYVGFASYRPPKRTESKSALRVAEALDTSAGSPDISRRPSSKEDSSNYDEPNSIFKRPHGTPTFSSDLPSHRTSSEVTSNPYILSSPKDTSSHEKHYSVPNAYKPPSDDYRSLKPSKIDLEYDTKNGGNKIYEDSPKSPYYHATIHGQSEGGYKLADAYNNQLFDHPVSSEEDGIQLKNGYSDEYIDEKVGYNGGSGKQHDADEVSNPQPFEYGYVLKDKHGNSQHRHETGDEHGSVKGSYGFTDEHGLYRSVQYVADKHGFRASILTNEPGTDNQDPADVKIKVEKH